MEKSGETMEKTTRLAFYILLVSGSLAILFYCFGGGISGNDFWWHIKTGEWICQNRRVPDRDIFSWYGVEHGFSWVAHEWLAEVLLWRIYQCGGEKGIYLFSLGGAMLMTFLLIGRVRPYLIKNCVVTAFYICLFCVLTSAFFYGRPHIFSFFLLYGELCCLYGFAEGGHGGRLCLIPILACLWSNLHGGSSNLSYLLVLAFLVCGIREWRVGRLYSVRWSRRQLLWLLAVLLLTVCAVCVNPAGYRMLLYPYECMADPVAMRLISEWASPDAKNIGELVLYFLPILLMSFGLCFGEQKVRLQDAAMMLFFLLLFFRSVRFIMLFYIAAAFWAFPYGVPCRLKNIEKNYEKLLLSGAEAVLIVLVCMGIGNCAETWRKGEMITVALEEEVIEFVREDAPVRLYNDYNYGGDLIFAEIPVFIDGRADVYAQDHLLAESASLLLLCDTGSGVPAVDALIERYGFDAFLIEVGRPLYSYLASHEERYEAVLVTGETAYFRKR